MMSQAIKRYPVTPFIQVVEDGNTLYLINAHAFVNRNGEEQLRGILASSNREPIPVMFDQGCNTMEGIFDTSKVQVTIL